MKTNFSKWIIGSAFIFSSSLSIAGGTDVFTNTQTSTSENISVTCTSYYEAPYTTQRVLGIKVATREYTGDFNYDRMDCRSIATYDNGTREVAFRINNMGDLMITDSNVPIITDNSDLEAIETVNNIASIFRTISNLPSTISTATTLYTNIGTFISGTSTVSAGTTAAAGAGTAATTEAAAAGGPTPLAVALFVLSIGIEIELGSKARERMRAAISEYMNNEAATFTKGVSDSFAITYGDAIKLQRYVSVMPAINHTILM